MEVKFELLDDLLIRFPFMQTSAIWSKMVIIILDTGVWRRGAWLKGKKVLLVVFSVVVLFFNEKGCLKRWSYWSTRRLEESILLLMLAQLLGKKSTPEKRYRC